MVSDYQDHWIPMVVHFAIVIRFRVAMALLPKQYMQAHACKL